MANDIDHRAIKPSTESKDSDHYGDIDMEEFLRRIQADNDARYGNVIHKASWDDVGEAGW